MKRCAYCEGEKACMACVQAGWKKSDAEKAYRALRDVEREYRKEKACKRNQDAMIGFVMVLVAIFLVWFAYDSTKVAVRYERDKPAILKAHGVR